MKNPILHIVILIFSILGFYSCNQKTSETPEQRAERVEKAVTIKFAKRRKERMNICKENAIKIAEHRVDSFLLAQAKMTTVDTLGKPLKPIKPDLPEFVPPKDSTDIKPLFEEDPDTIQ